MVPPKPSEAGSPDPWDLPEIDAVRRWMYAFGWHPEHMEQVARLSCLLFDELADLHALGPRWRRILAAAALVHDVGWTVSPSGHHKHAARIVRNSDLPGFDGPERDLVALVARYHRGKGPKPSHGRFAALDPADQDAVLTLAALIRIADGLDRSHLSGVQSLSCAATRDSVTIRLRVKRLVGDDISAAYRKSGLFEKVFRRSVGIFPG